MHIGETRLRGLRAAVFTAFAVTLSVASHVLLSGVPLPVPAVAAVAGGVFLVTYALAGRERGYGPIAAVLVPLELAADTVFTAGQHVCYGAAGGPVAGSLRAVGVDVFCGGAAGTRLPGVAAADGRLAALVDSPDPHVPWLLLAAHVSVGLAAAAWLRRGESALAGLLRAAALAAFRPLLIAVAVVRRRTAARPPTRVAARPSTARAHHFVHSVRRRGPPRPAAAPV
ncbi:hypothetical protein DDQ41_02955 [Streptomyces spongiicola]|uniref:Integral membrane protein n=1 Tax=Streptomyces spongiicola TaxID=1690221 RepID=A0ABM6V2Y5_9ACTN|nr:hypothetical protein [Streptomyces spongiicola]AWK08066.1 hypothetical protein DDQ41_02955 [Streptomyces spongiicola]